jgi:KaiC/GvpD/RAD55 family RecA-like ATPase
MDSVLKTHIEGLDAVLGGGIPRGHLVLVCGTPGTMKSTLCFTTMYHNAAQGRKGLYISLEQDGENLLRSMKKLGMTEAEERVHVLDLSMLRRELGDKERQKDWASMLVDVTRHAVAEDRYGMVTIDSLEAFYALAELGNPRREMFHLFTRIKELDVTTFFISEIPIGERQLTKYGEDFLTDGILLLEHFDVGETDVQLRIRCVKMREMRQQHGYFAVSHDGKRFLVSQVLSHRRRPSEHPVDAR